MIVEFSLGLTKLLIENADKLKNLIQKHPKITRYAGLIVIVFVPLLTFGYGVGKIYFKPETYFGSYQSCYSYYYVSKSSSKAGTKFGHINITVSESQPYIYTLAGCRYACLYPDSTGTPMFEKTHHTWNAEMIHFEPISKRMSFHFKSNDSYKFEGYCDLSISLNNAAIISGMANYFDGTQGEFSVYKDSVFADMEFQNDFASHPEPYLKGLVSPTPNVR